MDTDGLHITGGLNGSAISAEDLSEDPENGPGFFVGAGYGLNSTLTAFIKLAGASMNGGDYGLGHFDIGLRAYIPTSTQFVPYADAALAGRALVIAADDLGTEDDLQVTGYGVTLGGGLEFYPDRVFSFGVGLHWTFGSFTEAQMGSEQAELEEAIDATTARFDLGVTFWP